MTTILCDVYKGSKQPDLYVYVDRAQGLERVPEPLLKKMGEAKVALSFKLSADRRLAKEDPVKVIEAIRESGYFLQMPPQQFLSKNVSYND